MKDVEVYIKNFRGCESRYVFILKSRIGDLEKFIGKIREVVFCF